MVNTFSTDAGFMSLCELYSYIVFPVLASFTETDIVAFLFTSDFVITDSIFPAIATLLIINNTSNKPNNCCILILNFYLLVFKRCKCFYWK